jgi:hypothetical protein
MDLTLADAGMPARITRKLERAAIRSLRQLYDRLRNDSGALRKYLGFSDADFEKFYRSVEDMIRKDYPEDTLPHIHPKVNKRGVAVHRLNDPTRPRYEKRRQE